MLSQLNNNIPSRLFVNRKFSDDKNVFTPLINHILYSKQNKSFIGTLISNYISKKFNKVNFIH